jgi:O-antigen/teichoic acid export membrane protein
VALWLFFHFGFGVLSLAWAALCATVIVVVCQWLACARFKFFPGRGGRGRASWFSFKEIFAFGKDIFLVAVGTQLIMASQTIVITRMLGLEAAAAWSVGTRLFNLLSQIIWRISDMSGPAFAEMMVRGESVRLRGRYREVVMLTASLSGFAAVSFALCNSLFIPLWTHGKIQWPMTSDLLLGIWMIVLAVLHCHNAFVLLTKKVGFMRFVYFVEGVVFVTLSLLVARRGGLPAIIACSIVCSSVFSGAYGVWRISRHFNFSLREVSWDWLRPMGKMLLFYLPLAALVWWALLPLPSTMRLVCNAILTGSAGLYFFLRFGLPPSIQTEIIQHTPLLAQSLLKRICGGMA